MSRTAKPPKVPKRPPKSGEPLDPLALKQLRSSQRSLKLLNAKPDHTRAVVNNKNKALRTPEERSANQRANIMRLKAASGGGQIKKKYHTEEEKLRAIRQNIGRFNAVASASFRDIGLFPVIDIPQENSPTGKLIPGINWERRLDCQYNLELFDKTYLPNIFNLPWSDEHHIVNARLQKIILHGGKSAVAMRRAGGKTAVSRAAIIWAIAYGHRTFPVFIGSKEPLARRTLNTIKLLWQQSRLLLQDFPELAWSIHKLSEKGYLTRNQLFLGNPTHINWGTDRVRFPNLLLPREIAEVYLQYQPEFNPNEPPDSPKRGFLVNAEPYGYPNYWFPRSGNAIIGTAGIDGSIRGDADVHPITLEQPRPDIVLLDDVQKDQKAESPILRAKLIALIDGAIEGLAGPDREIAALMPCTVTCEGDASDTFVDPVKRPEWDGIRCKMVHSWPEGVTDYEITNDTEAGKLWNEYYQLWRTSKKDRVPLNNFYAINRGVMDRGFKVSWPDVYPPGYISAQQHAMEKRFAAPDSFLAEYQQIGRKLIPEGEVRITAAQLAAKVLDTPQRILPPWAEILVASIDVQSEILFYSVFACDHDFNGVVVDYGVWPEISLNYFTKAQAESWSAITTRFFEAYPQYRDKAIRNSRGKTRAPLEAKVYFGLQQFVPKLLARKYVRADTHKREFLIQKLSIDQRWGEASEAIKRFIRESRIKELVGYSGVALPPTNLQFEEYERRPGWLFEDNRHPNVKEPKWCLRPHQSDGSFYLQADVNRAKDFLFSRLSTPLGSPGCISLYKAPAEHHELFSHHVANSEYPEPVSARGITKNMWTPRSGSAYDNDWLDCFAANVILASFTGASLKTTDKFHRPPRRRLSDRANAKHAQRTRGVRILGSV